jgi:hypothetical protein
MLGPRSEDDQEREGRARECARSCGSKEYGVHRGGIDELPCALRALAHCVRPSGGPHQEEEKRRSSKTDKDARQ